MERTVVKNGLVITFIHEGYHSIKMKYADLLLEDGRIAEVAEQLPAGGANVLDAQGKLVLPGLVNVGACCAAAKLCSGLLPDYPRQNWQGSMLYHRALPLLEIADALLTEEEKTDLMRFAYADALRCGSTTLADLCLPGFAPAALQAAGELGLRARVTEWRTAAGLPFAEQEGLLRCPEPVGGQFPSYPAQGLARRQSGLYSLETTSPELWAAAAQSERLLLFGGYSRYEEQLCRMREGRSPIASIYEHGCLSEHTVVLHCLYTDFFDRERMRTARAHAALSAVEALQNAQPFPAVELLRQDINTALGTGWCGVSMLAELRAAAFGAKLQTGNAAQYQASDAFYAGTIAGAAALGEKIGRIEPGYAADLLILSPERLRPLNYPLINLVYGAEPQDIETVVIAGRVVRSPQLPDPMAPLAGRVQQLCERVWARARETIL